MRMGHGQVGQLSQSLACLFSPCHHHLRIEHLELPHEPGPPGINLFFPGRSLQNPEHQVEKGCLFLPQSCRIQDSGIALRKPWRDVQICKALFVWERLMGMILIVMFAIAVSKTIILGS
jgi:hypothetical protein